MDNEKLILTDDEEQLLLQNLNLIQSYFYNANIFDLNDKYLSEFNTFKNKSIKDIDELNELIKNYNSEILSIEEMDSEFYLRTQEFFTKPIENINSYIINVKSS